MKSSKPLKILLEGKIAGKISRGRPHNFHGWTTFVAGSIVPRKNFSGQPLTEILSKWGSPTFLMETANEEEEECYKGRLTNKEYVYEIVG